MLTDSAVGAQRPRIANVPEYASTSGDEAIALGELAGIYLDDWQQWCLRILLGERPDGQWAAKRAGIVVGRQNGKNEILVVRELAGLFLLGERLIVHSAHEWPTANEAFLRLEQRILDTPEFAARLPKGRNNGIIHSHGDEGITLTTGQRIRFKTRTKGGGKGFTGDLLVLDEAYDLPAAFIGATLPILSARPNPQVIYTSSAVNREIHDHGLMLAKVREDGMEGDTSLFYAEWSCDEEELEATPALIDDPYFWGQANPTLGGRLSVEWVRDVDRKGMLLAEFKSERLGIGNWPDTSEESGRVIARDVFEDAAEHDSANRITSTPVYAIDVNPDQTWGSIGIAGERDDGLYQGAVVEHLRGDDWIVGRCVELITQGEPVVVNARTTAASLIEGLEGAGLTVIRASTDDYGNACTTFLREIVSGRFKYPFPQPELDDALASARAKDLGDRWKWARRSPTGADISPLVAVTLALWGAHTQGTQYATLLIPGENEPAPEDQGEWRGPRPPREITQAETTTCFACRVGSCTVHGGQE